MYSSMRNQNFTYVKIWRQLIWRLKKLEAENVSLNKRLEELEREAWERETVALWKPAD